MRVALVSTAPIGAPGSMRAYAEVLMSALGAHAPNIEARLVELDPEPGPSAWGRRLRTLTLPLRARRLRGSAPDLWHVLDGSRAYVASGLQDAPVLITAHDIIPRLQQRGRFSGAPSVGVGSRWLWRRNGVALRRANALVCDSECTRRDVATEYGTPDDTRIVPLPVRPALAAHVDAQAGTARDRGLVLHVGNNGFYKHREQVLRIFSRLHRAHAVRLVMLGPRPTNAMLSLAGELAIEGAVEWVEDAGDATLADWYSRASVFVFPSLYEGYGWPVLEAMTFGLPVVCSNAGSLPEVAGDAAPCLAPDDVPGFVREIERLLLEPGLADERAARGRAWAAGFGLERFAQEMADVYRSVCSSSTGRVR